jgi:hypothetical protein
MAPRRAPGTAADAETDRPSAWTATAGATLVPMTDGVDDEDGELPLSTYEDESDEDAISDLTVESLSSIERASRILTLVAAVAALLWVIALIVTFSAAWTQFEGISSGFGGTGSEATNDRLVRTLATALSNTWGYLLVAVLAYAASSLAEARRAAVLIDALED